MLFGYANPIVVMGPDAFAAAARGAGADGVLCVDYPPDEDCELPTALARHELDFIPLLAPTSTPARVEVAVKVARGFIYYVSLTGITGTALADLDGPRKQVAAIKARAGGNIPVAVGFGIGTPGAARSVATFADGVVVGSAAVDLVDKAVSAGRDPSPSWGRSSAPCAGHSAPDDVGATVRGGGGCRFAVRRPHSIFVRFSGVAEQNPRRQDAKQIRAQREVG